jgi:integrase/recombinase XerD
MDNQNQLTQQIYLKTLQENNLLALLDEFLSDCRMRNLTRLTIDDYKQKLSIFLSYCHAQMVLNISDVNVNLLRNFILYLQQTHNPGGVHGIYRPLKCFLNWIEFEFEDYRNPIKHIRSPKVAELVLPPTPLEDIFSLVSTCKSQKNVDVRDRSLLLTLLDSGCRSREFLDINIEDVNLVSGSIIIKRGKSQKTRIIFVGKKARIALRRYLKHRDDNNPCLWITKSGERLTYDGLRAILTRRSKLCGIKTPNLHGFRRACAISLLRQGVNLFLIQKHLGHEGMTMLKRYLKLADQDMKIKSVADNYFK